MDIIFCTPTIENSHMQAFPLAQAFQPNLRLFNRPTFCERSAWSTLRRYWSCNFYATRAFRSVINFCIFLWAASAEHLPKALELQLLCNQSVSEIWLWEVCHINTNTSQLIRFKDTDTCIDAWDPLINVIKLTLFCQPLSVAIQNIFCQKIGFVFH